MTVAVAVDLGTLGHALTDPVSFIVDGVGGLIGHVVTDATSEVSGLLDRFLFRTVDPTVRGNRPLTANPDVARLNLGMTVAVDALIAAVFVITSLRSVFERSMRSHYDLKVVLPRVLLAIVLAHASLPLAQLAIDLNNALASVALSLGGPINGDTVPWAASLSPGVTAGFISGQNLFRALLALALVLGTALLALTYVIRTALLNVLLVTAPLAALLGVIPDTRGHARAWVRLFTTTLFMQAVQLVILRVAVTMELDPSGGMLTTVYGMATLWLMLKVPGAMNTGVHLESKAHTVLHSLERSVRHHVMPTHRATHRRAA